MSPATAPHQPSVEPQTTLEPVQLVVPNSIAIGGIFPTPLVTGQIKDHAALNAELRSTILAREQVEGSSAMSNIGGWHSQDFLPWAGAAGAAVINAAREIVDRLTMMEVGDKRVPAKVTWRVASWANIIRKGHSNRPHCHPAAFWSGTYWVDDGGAADGKSGGLFEISDPRGVAPLMHAPYLRFALKDCWSDGEGQVLIPKAGMMILFPAWLVHAVTPYEGEQARISIAFNFSL